MIEKLDNLLSRPFIPWLIAALAVLLYLPSWTYEFTVDDTPAIVENKLVNEGLSGLGDIWSNSYYYGYDEREEANEYRPIASSFYALQYSLFDENPSGYHALSTLLYGLLVGLVFLVLLDWGARRRMAFLASLIFLAHPIHTEVVANIKSQDELLMGIFLLLAIHFWCKYLKEKKPVQLLVSLFTATLALFAKESALVFIVFLIPATAWIQGQWKSAVQFAFLAPIGLMLLVRAAVLSVSPEPTVVNNALVYQESWLNQMAMSFDLFLRYLGKAIWPTSLSWDYSFNQIPLHGWESPLTWLGLVLFMAMPVLIVLNRKSRPLLSLGLLLFWGGILLYTQLLVLLEATFAERFLFLPALGLIIVLLDLVPKGNWRIGTSAGLALICAVMTLNRSSDWESNEVLYAADLDKVNNSIRAKTAYAYVLYEKSLNIEDLETKKPIIEESNDLYREAINIYGKDANTWFNYGMNNLSIGDYTMSELAFKQAVALRPDHTSAYNNLGNIQYLKGEQAQAKEYYAAAVRADETNAEAWSNLGAVYLLFKQNDSAYMSLSKATELNPKHENAQYNLGVVKKRLGIAP